MGHPWKIAACACLLAYAATASAADERTPTPKVRPQIAELEEVPAALRATFEEKIDRVMRDSLLIVEDEKSALPSAEREAALSAWHGLKERWMNLQDAESAAWPARWGDFMTAWQQFRSRWQAAGETAMPTVPTQD
jgi:hypothetical protein